MSTNHAIRPECPRCTQRTVATMLMWTNAFHFRCDTCGHNWTGVGLSAKAA